MAISILNQNDNVYVDPGTTFSLTHTVSAGSNRLLLVLVGYENEDNETINSVVWDPTGLNEALTEISTYSTSDDALVSAYYLIAPSTGTALSITVTLSGGLTDSASSVVAFTLDGVDQSTPIRDEDGDAQQNVNTLSATVTGLTSGDFLAVHANQENTGQTMDYDDSTFTVTLTQDNVTSGQSTFHSGYGTADAASETAEMDSTITEHSALQLVAIAPAAVSSSSSRSSSSSSSSRSSSSSSQSSCVPTVIEDIAVYESLSSSSSSSSSRSSSSSSSRSSSSSSSSSSALCGEVTWGHHTGVLETFDEDFTGSTIGWDIGGTPGNDDEYIDATSCGNCVLFERWCLGVGEAEILIDNYGTGYGPAPIIEYRTAVTGVGLLVAPWTVYNGYSFISLKWVQIRICHEEAPLNRITETGIQRVTEDSTGVGNIRITETG